MVVSTAVVIIFLYGVSYIVWNQLGSIAGSSKEQMTVRVGGCIAQTSLKFPFKVDRLKI